MRPDCALWLPLLPGLLLHVASGKPTGRDRPSSPLPRDGPPPALAARANNNRDPAPGIGVELEYRNMVLKSEKPEAAAAFDQVDPIKGSEMRLVGNDKANAVLDAQSRFWKLTAEHSGTEEHVAIANLISEIIVDGTTVKIGAKDPVPVPGPGDLTGLPLDVVTPKSLKDIGKAITDFLGLMAPKKGLQVSIPGFDQYGPWTAANPDNFVGPASTVWGMQITAPMPLEVIQSCFVSRLESCPILSSNTRTVDRLVKVERRHFERFTKIAPADVDDEFLGFFSLVTSYALAAKDGNRDTGPKQALPIMPRTNFATMYKEYVQKKIRPELEQTNCGTLYGMVSYLAKQVKGRSLDDDDFFKWPRAGARPASSLPGQAGLVPRAKTGANQATTWETQSEDHARGELDVETWLNELEDGKDVLSAMDEQIFDGTIGALGSRMETTVESSKLCPIFEFRDLAGVNGDKFEEEFDKIDSYIVRMHQQHPTTPLRARDARRRSAPSLEERADGDPLDSDDPCKCGKKRKKNRKQCKRCPLGQIRVTVGPVSTCQGCELGKKANAGGDKCEMECPTGKKANAAGDKCEMECPTGQKSSAGGDKCELDCPLGKKASVGGDKCEMDCPLGQKSNAGGDKCELDCPKGQKESGGKCAPEKSDEDKEKEKKEKDGKEEKDKKEKAKKVGRAGTCLAFLAAGVATETFNPDDLEEAAQDWPSDVPWVEGELTESNIELPAPPVVIGATDSTAGFGFGGLIKALVGAARGSIKTGTAAAKASNAGTKTAPKGSAASKKTIEGLKSNKAFKACLAMSPETPATPTRAKLHFGPEIPAGGFVADEAPKPVAVQFCTTEDCHDGWGNDTPKITYQSWPDSFHRWARIELDKCINLGDPFVKADGKSAVTGYTVEDGCCTFYKEKDCKAGLFAANNREDQNLQGKSNDAIKSFMCNHNACNGHPK
ncbi:MAG: hypothetical protein M1832_001440 [Thelocarpon impressellum]|nr:MAG: hypothetical protein M1832_001440 [Thelocarpon impressellum]